MALLSYGRAVTALAESDPDRAAVTCGDQSITRLELDLRSNRLARAYESLGVQQGDLVTVALPNSVEFYEACVAVWKLGATPQPVSYRLPDRERQAIVELADSRLVIGAEPGAHPGRTVIPAGFEPDPQLSDGPLPDRISPTWKAPTSGGSTGRPKLILSGSPAVVDTDGEAALLAGRDGLPRGARPALPQRPLHLLDDRAGATATTSWSCPSSMPRPRCGRSTTTGPRSSCWCRR